MTGIDPAALVTDEAVTAYAVTLRDAANLLRATRRVIRSGNADYNQGWADAAHVLHALADSLEATRKADTE